MSGQFFVGIFTELLALFLGIYFFKQVKKGFLILFVFVLVSFLTEIAKPILSYGFGIHRNLWMSHFYFPLEFLLLALFYLKKLGDYYKRSWMVALIIAFLLFSVVNPLFLQDLTEYSQIRSFSSIILVLFAILYFFRVMNEARIQKLSDEPMIWINTAVLLYYAVSLFYNVLFMLVLEYSRPFAVLISALNVFMLIVFYGLIAIGFWKAGKQQIVSDG